MQQRILRAMGLSTGGAMGLMIVALVLTAGGCSGGDSGVPTVGPMPDEPDAPQAKDLTDPALREMREQADTILSDLLAGKLDKDAALAPVAARLKPYTSYAVKTQKIEDQRSAEIRGVLTGTGKRARFNVALVKQKNGKWAIGTFSGPYP